MKVDELLEIKRRLFERSDMLTIVKGEDYSFGGDTLRNLRVCERVGLCGAEVGVLVRLLDKVGRLVCSCEKDVFSVDEGLEDTVVDAINYLCMFFALKKEKMELKKKND